MDITFLLFISPIFLSCLPPTASLLLMTSLLNELPVYVHRGIWWGDGLLLVVLAVVWLADWVLLCLALLCFAFGNPLYFIRFFFYRILVNVSSLQLKKLSLCLLAKTDYL